MKNLLLITTFLCLAVGLFAQQDVIVLSRPIAQAQLNEKIIDVYADEYTFPERIDEFYVDSAGQFAGVHLRGLSKNGKYLNNSGSFVFYDLVNKKANWNRKINFQTENVVITGDRPLLMRGDRSIALRKMDGSDDWSIKSLIYYVNKKHNIGLAYKISSVNQTSSKIEAINMNNGATIWTSNLDRDFGWNDIKQMNDSVILVTSSGLNTINLYNGGGWNYRSLTGKRQTGEAVAKGVRSVLLGVLTGVTMVPNVDVVTGIVSNTLMDSTGIYLATAEKISRLNDDGAVIWENELDKGKSSASKIFRNNGKVYLMNRGYAFENGKMRNYGTPFIAIYDVQTGAQVFQTVFDEKNAVLNDFYVQNITLNVLLHNKIIQYSLKNNILIAEKTIDTQKFGYLFGFGNDVIYKKMDNKILPAKSDNSQKVILTSNDGVLIVDENLEVEQEFYKNEYYSQFAKTDNYKLLYKDGEMNVLSLDNELIVKFEASSSAEFKDGKIIDTVNNKVLRIIDLNVLKLKK